MDKKVGVGESSKVETIIVTIKGREIYRFRKKDNGLMVRSTTTVREMKEQLEKKEEIPAAKQKLRTRGGKFLLQQDLSLKESCVGRQATLVMSVRCAVFESPTVQ